MRVLVHGFYGGRAVGLAFHRTGLSSVPKLVSSHSCALLTFSIRAAVARRVPQRGPVEPVIGIRGQHDHHRPLTFALLVRQNQMSRFSDDR